jgi:hypothetical protein
MNKLILILTISAAITIMMINPEAFTEERKIVIGRIEWVSIPKLGLNLQSRIDTGARKCSLHAVNEQEISAGKDLFVEFSTVDNSGKTIRLKSKVWRTVKIRSTSGESSRRYIIKERITMGSVTRDAFINLNDRSTLKYKFLVGRNFLRGKFLVDVSQSHVLAD